MRVVVRVTMTTSRTLVKAIKTHIVAITKSWSKSTMAMNALKGLINCPTSTK
jgi:hypothetical protein